MSALDPLLGRVAALLERIQGIQLVIPHDTGYFRIDDALIDNIRALLADSGVLLRDVTDYFDEIAPRDRPIIDSGDDDTGSLIRIGAEIANQMAAREIADLAFAARTQLQEIQGSLGGAVMRREVWMIASHADTGLRRAGKALITVESAIREFESLPPENRLWSDLDDSLETRRLYGQLRRAVKRRDVEKAGLRESLKSAANRIAILRDLKVYPLLRIDDRLQIRRLQKRILGWLDQQDDGPEATAAGERLWGDLSAFADLLSQVNNREELVDHDRRAVAEAYHRLFESGPVPDRIPPQRLSLLEPLLGRDDELDQVVLLPTEHHTEDLRAPLERLRAELTRRPAVQPADDEPSADDDAPESLVRPPGASKG